LEVALHTATAHLHTFAAAQFVAGLI
jgi:hypothetical protein